MRAAKIEIPVASAASRTHSSAQQSETSVHSLCDWRCMSLWHRQYLPTALARDLIYGDSYTCTGTDRALDCAMLTFGQCPSPPVCHSWSYVDLSQEKESSCVAPASHSAMSSTPFGVAKLFKCCRDSGTGHMPESCSVSSGMENASISAYLLGLLAMIKCSICSYQCDI